MQNDTLQMGIARWSMAKMMRHLGRVEEALALQRELLESTERTGAEPDGYVFEEIGECLFALGRVDEAAPHFARAFELLKNDPWLRQDEPQRLERLKQLGLDPVGSTPAEHAAQIRDDLQRWAKLAKAANVKVD